jgi:2'-5' RNA ligase
MPQLKSHDFEEVYRGLGINLSTLGCVMLDVEPLDNMYSMHAEGGESNLYYAKDKSRFWINGWVCDKTAHVTLLYGLLETAKNYEWHIEQIMKDWKLPEIEIESVGYFDSPYEDEPYYCIVAHIKVTPELLEKHQRLEFLPHVNTFAGYKPHMTICYIKKELGEQFRDSLIKSYNEAFVGKPMKANPVLNLGGNK